MDINEQQTRPEGPFSMEPPSEPLPSAPLPPAPQKRPSMLPSMSSLPAMPSVLKSGRKWGRYDYFLAFVIVVLVVLLIMIGVPSCINEYVSPFERFDELFECNNSGGGGGGGGGGGHRDIFGRSRLCDCGINA
jgi:hypothetical protein